MSQKNKYKAFISYSHVDRNLARWLHRKIEGYHVPKHLVGKPTPMGPVPARLTPVFRDRDDLASSPDLSARIREALESSESLLVICSPSAAKSSYVNREIETFQRLGRSDRIFCLIVAGDPAAAGTAEDCFPPALRQPFDAQGREAAGVTEPIAADVRPEGDGRSLARLKLLAGVLGVGLDELRQRELQRRLRRMVALTVLSLTALAVTIALALAAHFARQEAEQRRTQAENLLGFMVEDLRDSLEPLGRLDLLEKVGNQAMDYFATVNIHNQTDDELTRHAQVMTQLGEIRIDERQYEAALESFREAYERSAALYRNDPSDSTRLFNRGQAEFWVGYVYWRRGDLEEARTWLTLYFDSTVELASMDPTRQDWALEVVYGQHNLAVLALDAEDLEAARAAFTAEIDVLHQVGRADPDFDPRQRSADAYSWLGNIEFAAGDLHKARANYAEAAGLFQALVDESPDNRDLQYSWSHASNYVAIVQNLTGQRVEAGRSAERVVRVLDDLVQHDPQNMEWLRSSAKPRITGAAVFAAAGSWPQADELLSAAFTILEGMAAGDDTDVSVHEMLADALLLRAWVARATGETAGSRQFLDEARAHLRAIEDRGALNDERRGRLAAALVMEGEIQAAENELTGAQESWQAALAQLSQVSGGADSPYVQDPLARALMWTGQTDRASTVMQRLNQQGYLPIRPWPDVPD